MAFHHYIRGGDGSSKVGGLIVDNTNARLVANAQLAKRNHFFARTRTCGKKSRPILRVVNFKTTGSDKQKVFNTFEPLRAQCLYPMVLATNAAVVITLSYAHISDALRTKHTPLASYRDPE